MEKGRAVPVEHGGASQNHRVVVGPFGGVAPALLVAVPEVAAGRITHDPLRKTLPDGESKVHLDKTLARSEFTVNITRKKTTNNQTTTTRKTDLCRVGTLFKYVFNLFQGHTLQINLKTI